MSKAAPGSLGLKMSGFRMFFAVVGTLLLSGTAGQAAAPQQADDKQQPAAAARPQSLSPDQAKALVQDAVALINREGLDKARAEFHKIGPYRHDDIYVNVVDFGGIWQVYPPQPGGEGKSVLGVQDAEGKFLVQEIVALAKKQGEGWVNYTWQNPQTKKIQPKLSFVKRVPDRDLVVYVGIYR